MNKCIQKEEYTQSQGGGFAWENDIRVNVFGLPKEKNNTDVHDVDCKKNKYNENENVNIKTTCSGNIDCGDILRFYTYDHNYKNTIFLVKYKQDNDYKILEAVYEIDYCKELHKILFGSISELELKKYVNNVKKIPTNVKGNEAKNIFDYLLEKEKLQKKYNMKINISPKVDTSQSRVQCSIPNFEILCKEFIKYKENNNYIRGHKISDKINSSSRKRKGICVKDLKTICRNNKLHGYSKMRKHQLLSFIKKNNDEIKEIQEII